MARIIYPQLFRPVSQSPETTTVDRWHQPLSLPRWSKALSSAAAQSAATQPASTSPETVSEDRWHQPFSLPVWPKPGLSAAQQRAYAAPVSTAPETVSEDRWHQPFSLPVWPKPGLSAAQQLAYVAPVSLNAETTTVDRWHQRLSEPVRIRPTDFNKSALAWFNFTPPIVITDISWFQGLTTPVWPKSGLAAQQQQTYTAPVSLSPETTTVDRWYQPLSEPVRLRPTDFNKYAFSWFNFTPPIVINDISWFQNLSAPVWPKKGLAAEQQDPYTAPASTAPESTSVDRWHQSLSLPVRRTPKDLAQSAFFWSGNTPITVTGTIEWCQQLSSPTRRVSSGFAALQSAFFAPTTTPAATTGRLFLPPPMSGLGTGGPFFSDRLGG